MFIVLIYNIRKAALIFPYALVFGIRGDKFTVLLFVRTGCFTFSSFVEAFSDLRINCASGMEIIITVTVHPGGPIMNILINQKIGLVVSFTFSFKRP